MSKVLTPAAGDAEEALLKAEQEKQIVIDSGETKEVTPDDGHTLSKVTIYVDLTGPLTEEDRAVITDAVIKALEDSYVTQQQIVPEFVDDIQQCVDTDKLYVLPDGFIYAYNDGQFANTGHEFLFVQAEKPGKDGFSPIVTVTKNAGGHTVSIQDVNKTHVFDVSNGDDGDDGVGIEEAVMNADYSLTLKFDDGSEFNTGSIRGEPGKDGNMANITSISNAEIEAILNTDFSIGG